MTSEGSHFRPWWHRYVDVLVRAKTAWVVFGLSIFLFYSSPYAIWSPHLKTFYVPQLELASPRAATRTGWAILLSDSYCPRAELPVFAKQSFLEIHQLRGEAAIVRVARERCLAWEVAGADGRREVSLRQYWLIEQRMGALVGGLLLVLSLMLFWQNIARDLTEHEPGGWREGR